MARFVHADILDFGLNRLKTECDKMAAIAAYTLGDSYATVTADANMLAEVAMADADFTISAESTGRKVVSASGKSAVADDQAAVTHIAFLDTVGSKVLWVTDETSGQTIFVGNTVNFPSLSLIAPQPAQS
jgi:hypothetical protein